MRRLILLTAATALTACGDTTETDAAPAVEPAAAEAGPLQPGLWETATLDGTERGKPDISRICVGDNEQGSPKDAMAKLDDPDCKVSRFEGAAGVTAHAECLKDGVRFITDATWSARRTTYSFGLKTRAVMPDGQVHESNITAKGRRLGPCPSGMEPGEADAE